MASLETVLYASQRNGGSPSVSIADISALVGGDLQAADVPANAGVIPSAAPAGGTGTTAGAWDTSADRDAAIAAINANTALGSSLKTSVNAILASLKAAGLMA